MGALSAGTIAHEFGLAVPIITIAALTFVSGVIVAVLSGNVLVRNCHKYRGGRKSEMMGLRDCGAM